MLEALIALATASSAAEKEVKPRANDGRIIGIDSGIIDTEATLVVQNDLWPF